MSYHLICLSSAGKLIGTIGPVEDPHRFQWEDDRIIELYDSLTAFEARLAELQPAPTVEPDWAQFRTQMVMHSAYHRIVGAHPQNYQILNPQLIPLLWRMRDDPSLAPDVANLWNAIAYNAQPTPIEIEQLNAIAAACNVPFVLNDAGMMLP